MKCGLVHWLLGLVADVLFGRAEGDVYVSRTNGPGWTD